MSETSSLRAELPSKFSPRTRGTAPWTMLAMGAVIILVVFTIGAVALKLAFDAGLPGEPLEFPPPAPPSPELEARWSEAATSQSEVLLTPEELSSLVQAEFSRWAERGDVGEISRFACELTGPENSRVRFRISVQLSQSAGTWLAGRFVNVDATLHVVRDRGEFTLFEIDRYQYGSLDPVSPEDSAALLERLEREGRLPESIWTALDRVREFRVVEDRLHLRMSGDG